MEQWSNGAMEQWSNGPKDQRDKWTNGPIYQWTNGPMDQTIPNPLQPPHLLNSELSIVHYQNEILYFVCWKSSTNIIRKWKQNINIPTPGANKLRKHLKSHTNASNAILMASSCDICKYTVQQSHTNVICVASFWKDRLGKDLKTCSVEKLNKFNHCDFVST